MTPTIQDKINYYVINNLFKPKVKIIYNRTSYYKDNIRMTLDENLISYIETDEENLFIDRSKNGIEVMNFAYSILELKTENGETYNEIKHIKELIESKKIIEIPEFSKYLTSTYYFFGNKLNAKPYWYDDYINGICLTTIFENILNKPINQNDYNPEHNQRKIMPESFLSNNETMTKKADEAKVILPIALKPNLFTTVESLYYKIFNLIIGIPWTLSQYDKLTNHESLLLRPVVLKYYLIICILLNTVIYTQINHGLINRTLNHMGTIFPILLAGILILSILF